MAKLTKAQRKQIEKALEEAERAYADLNSDRVVITWTDWKATTIHHYTNPEGKIIMEMNKPSMLIFLTKCISTLRTLLEESQ